MSTKYLCIAALLVSGAVPAFAQNPPNNAELVGHWDRYPGGYGDVWGDGDYAYVGHFGHHGVHILDVSDPANPTFVAEYIIPPPDDTGSAQDVKVANGLLFIGVEGGNQTAYIVDVRDPSDPQPLTTVNIPGYRSIHNLFYDGGYLYIADSNTTRVGIIDLTQLDPDHPPAGPITTAQWIIEDVGTSRVHDVTVQDGILYASAWDSGLWIYDVSNVADEPPIFLGNTPDGGNNTHSAWATANGDFVVVGEEFSGGGIKVYRITHNEGRVDLHLTDNRALPVSEASSVHNQTIIGYRLYNSWYGAGLQVFDINPLSGQLRFVASYDTTAGGGGAWGVYPFMGPERVLVSDIGNGLFVIAVDPESGDLNGNGEVDAADLAMLLGNWGPCTGCPADLNDDGAVNAADLALLLGNWG